MKVFSNTAISLDGRINTPDDRTASLGSKKDHQMMDVLRGQADAVLVGGATFRHWPHPLVASRTDSANPVWNIVLTRRLDMQPSAEYLQDKRIRPLFLVPADATRESFPAEVLSYDGPGRDLPIPWVIQALERRGVKSLLVEAGGDLLFQFLEADALDEMYVTLCPKLIGGPSTPSLVDGKGFNLATLRTLQLLRADVQEDEIFLHYRVNRSR